MKCIYDSCTRYGKGWLKKMVSDLALKDKLDKAGSTCYDTFINLVVSTGFGRGYWSRRGSFQLSLDATDGDVGDRLRGRVHGH